MVAHIKKRCVRGHPYDETTPTNKLGMYVCMDCHRERNKYNYYGMKRRRSGWVTSLHPRIAVLLLELLRAGAGHTELSRVPELGLSRRQVAYFAEKQGDFLGSVNRVKNFDFAPYRARLEQAAKDWAMRGAYAEARGLLEEYELRLHIAARADFRARHRHPANRGMVG